MPASSQPTFLHPFYLDRELTKGILEAFFVNKDNIDLDVLDNFWERGIDIISYKKLYQFAYMLEKNELCRFPKHPRLCRATSGTPLEAFFCPRSYIEDLQKIQTPILAIAGKGDEVAGTDDVFKIRELAGSDDITTQVFSEDKNYSADYGHLDLILGFNARDEVFPAIYDWLMNRI